MSAISNEAQSDRIVIKDQINDLKIDRRDFLGAAALAAFAFGGYKSETSAAEIAKTAARIVPDKIPQVTVKEILSKEGEKRHIGKLVELEAYCKPLPAEGFLSPVPGPKGLIKVYMYAIYNAGVDPENLKKEPFIKARSTENIGAGKVHVKGKLTEDTLVPEPPRPVILDDIHRI